MAVKVFLLLNGMGVVFLVYVLANFWREGRRPASGTQSPAKELESREKIEVVVVTLPISQGAQGGLSVIPLQARGSFGARPDRQAGARGVVEMPVKRISSR